MPFLLVCLTGGAVMLLQTQSHTITIPATGQFALAGLASFCLWGLWRWRRMLPLLPTPPWHAALQALARRQLRPDPRLRLLRRRLVRLQVWTRLHPAPAPPRPLAPPRIPRRPRLRVVRSQHAPRSVTRVRLPRPTLAVQFVQPSQPRPVVDDAHQMQAGIVALLHDLLRQHAEVPPDLLALHDQARQIVVQVAANPLLTRGQQRAISQALQVQGLSSQWRDVTLLAIRRDHLRTALPAPPTDQMPTQLWVPAVRTRQGTIWWPLVRPRHLVLAGAMHGPLTGLIARLNRVPAALRPALLIHDPDGRLREVNDTLAALVPQPDALAQARHAQLHQRFARERGHATLAPSPPLLLMVTPTAAEWPDLHPLLAPASGVQVVLILGDREPLAALRATCHRLPVIDIPDPRYPALPDAFRPAGLPTVSIGQALAWLPGGQTVWRGLPPLVEVPPLQSDSMEGTG
jgi:hypothetical protein